MARVRAAVAAPGCGSGLRAELDGWRIAAEVPFVLGVGGTVIRGQIDLLADGPDGERCVIDFKTDALRGRSPAQLAERYAAQREVYALAVAGRRRARSARCTSSWSRPTSRSSRSSGRPSWSRPARAWRA